MESFVMLYLVFALADIAKIIKAIPAGEDKYKKHVGYKLIGKPFYEIDSATRIMCTAECGLVGDCLGINFIQDVNDIPKCQLFDFNVTKENLVEYANSTFIEKFKLDHLFLGNEISLLGLACEQKTDYHGHKCFYAIDQILASHCIISPCAHTDQTYKPWWQVDFGMQRIITRVMLYNRDIQATWLDNFTIRTQDYPMPNQGGSRSCVRDVPYDPEMIRTFICDEPVIGRYLVVQIDKDNHYLILIEVRVFGY